MTSNYECEVPRIVLADLHPLSRYGTRVALTSWHVAKVVGEAASKKQLFDILASRPCDIVLIDYILQEQGGGHPTMIEQLVQQYPHISIVIVTGLRNPGLVDRAFADGIKAWVDKGETRSELIASVQEVKAGRVYLSKATRAMLKEVGIERLGSRPSLSRMEATVLSLSVYESLDISAIAERLRSGYKVISRHKRLAFGKLGLKNDQQLHEYCCWVDLPLCKERKANMKNNGSVEKVSQ